LLGADLVLSACAKDHWTWRWAGKIIGCYERTRVPHDVCKKLPDKAATARSLQAMLQLPARRLLVGHAEVIEEGCRDRLAEAWRLEGVQV
jgi:hypothetical protein